MVYTARFLIKHLKWFSNITISFIIFFYNYQELFILKKSNYWYQEFFFIISENNFKVKKITHL